MGLLKDMGDRLVSQSVAGWPGTTQVTATGWTVFQGHLPVGAPATVVALFETGGPALEPKAGLDRPRFQVRVRGSSFAYDTARTKLLAARNALHGFSGVVNGTTYSVVLGDSDALHLGNDENNRPEIVQTFKALVKRTDG